MRTYSLISIIFTLAILGVFGFSQQTFAQQQITVPEGNRLCLFDMTVFGVRDSVIERILNTPDSDIKANILIAELSRGTQDIGESLCGLRLRGTENATLKNGSTVAPIGQKINIRSLFQAAMVGSRPAAERAEKPAVFFEGGRIKQINADGSIANCHPVPISVYQEMMQKSGTPLFDLNQFGTSDDPVTENACPRIQANFYQNIGGGNSYLLSFTLTDGGGPNQKVEVAEPRLLNNPAEPKTDLSTLGKQLNIISAKSLPQLIGQLLSIGMGIIGSIALAVIIAAGILWMTAAGNSQREKTAMEMLFWGALGVIVILGSYAIVQLIFTDLF